MIIGNNNNRNNNSFLNSTFPKFTKNSDDKFKIKEDRKQQPLATGKKATDYFNVSSKNEMTEKSYAMLQERYNNGLISLEEFTKKCQQLNKLNKK